MSNDSMGNLEKLGILVIVILVVVVGVVAITPEQTFFPDAGHGDVADLRNVDVNARSEDARDGGEEKLPPIDVKSEAPDPIWPDPVPPVTPDPVKPEPVKPDPVVHVDPEPEPAPEPPTPSFREYKVQSGDSFYRIAERELGDVRRAKQIQAANPDVDPRRMRIGQVLRLPIGDAAVSESGRRLSGRGDVTPSPDGPTGRTYVVKPNDTAMGISATLYGTVAHWRLLLEHNGISDPESLRADTVLKVPELPRAASNPAPETSRSPAAPAAATSYVVQKNDTLMGIAGSRLGKSGRWREILDLNGLADASELRAGATIRLPAR